MQNQIHGSQCRDRNVKNNEAICTSELLTARSAPDELLFCEGPCSKAAHYLFLLWHTMSKSSLMPLIWFDIIDDIVLAWYILVDKFIFNQIIKNWMMHSTPLGRNASRPFRLDWYKWGTDLRATHNKNNKYNYSQSFKNRSNWSGWRTPFYNDSGAQYCWDRFD